jgi:hypothetical protein
MTDTPAQPRQCPTRLDGAGPLIVQSISTSVCSDRQARNYHKCYSCEHRVGAHVSAPTSSGRSVELVPVAPPTELPAPPQRTAQTA